MVEQVGNLPQTVDFVSAGRGGPDYSKYTVCIIDHGLFAWLAETLAPWFGRTLYFSHWQQSFPRSNALLPGRGLAGVERIDQLWPHIDEIDLFVFPDVFDGALQHYLRSLGKRVWGSGLAERLEIDRGNAKDWFAQLGLPVGPYRILRGTQELRRHLQRYDNQFVKNNTRGDMESFHSENYDLIEPRIDELEYTLGIQKTETEFVVESAIEAKAEVGYDGYTIDGQYPQQALFGVETKDAGYVGEVVNTNGLPRAVGYVNQKLAPLFKDLNYRGFWSSEIRVAEDNTPYLIDPCCRTASPPGELYSFLIANLHEVMWEGAMGNLVEPVWRHSYGAQLILRSSWAETGWQPIEFDPALAQHVKLHYLTKIAGKSYYVPQQIQMPEIGAVVAGGDTIQEAMANCVAIAEQVKGYDVKFDESALKQAVKGMGALRAA